MDLRCRILGGVLREEDCSPSLSLSLTIPAGDYPGSVTLSSIGDGVRITKALDKRLIFSIPLVFHERNKIGITGVFFWEEIRSSYFFFFKFVAMSEEIENICHLLKKIVIFTPCFLNRLFRWVLSNPL